MPELLLYLWSGARRRYLDQHEFYVEQVRKRVLSQFDNLEAEAEQHGQDVYRRMGHGGVAEEDAAEAAYDEIGSHFEALTDLRKQVLLGALAGMYHQFDKTLRAFLERELSNDLDRAGIEKAVWNEPFDAVLNVLEQFGWNVSTRPFYKTLDALQRIVNVYKHGKGRSLTQLKDAHPEYVVDPLGAYIPLGLELGLEHEWLTVTDEQFDQFANAITEFWTEMPERLTMSLPA